MINKDPWFVGQRVACHIFGVGEIALIESDSRYIQVNYSDVVFWYNSNGIALGDHFDLGTQLWDMEP